MAPFRTPDILIADIRKAINRVLVSPETKDTTKAPPRPSLLVNLIPDSAHHSHYRHQEHDMA